MHSTAELNGIENRLGWLAQLREIEKKLTGKQEFMAAKVKIGQARNEISLKRDNEAKTLIDDVTKLLTQVPAETAGPEVASVLESVEDMRKNMEGQLRPSASGRSLLIRDWLIKLTALSDEVRAEGLPLLRILFWLLTIFALSLLGMQSLYANNATFGASPFSDYLGLVFWGLSSETAARTLSNLKTT